MYPSRQASAGQRMATHALSKGIPTSSVQLPTSSVPVGDEVGWRSRGGLGLAPGSCRAACSGRGTRRPANVVARRKLTSLSQFLCVYESRVTRHEGSAPVGGIGMPGRSTGDRFENKNKQGKRTQNPGPKWRIKAGSGEPSESSAHDGPLNKRRPATGKETED